MQFRAIAIFLATFVAVSAPVLAGGLKIELPLETSSFIRGEHSDIASAQCLICHSAEYVTTQPRLNRVGWKASIVKMREKYGAPISTNQVEQLADYLVTFYGAAEGNQVRTPVSSNGIPASVEQPSSGAQLITKYGCAGCHQQRLKFVGPAWKQIAEKYQHDPGAAEKIIQQVKNGGSGKWGPVLMPAFTSISGAEAKAIAEWLLQQK